MTTETKARFRAGQRVYIEGKPTKLRSRLSIPGGWWVDPPIDNIRFWNEDAMTTTAPRRKK